MDYFLVLTTAYNHIEWKSDTFNEELKLTQYFVNSFLKDLYGVGVHKFLFTIVHQGINF